MEIYRYAPTIGSEDLSSAVKPKTAIIHSSTEQMTMPHTITYSTGNESEKDEENIVARF